MEDYIKEFISKLQRAYESDSMQYNYSVLEIPSKDLTTEVTILLKKARKKFLEEEIATVDNLEWCTRAENQQHSRDVLGNTNLGNRNGNHGYRKSRFYPSEAIRSRLIELGIPRAKHDIVQLGEMLPDGGLWLKDEIGTVRTFKAYKCWWCEYCLGEEDIPAPMCKPLHRQCADTEADARANMLIYLAENGLLDVKSLTNNKGHE